MENVEEAPMLMILIFPGLLLQNMPLHCHAEDKQLFWLPNQGPFDIRLRLSHHGRLQWCAIAYKGWCNLYSARHKTRIFIDYLYLFNVLFVFYWYANPIFHHLYQCDAKKKGSYCWLKQYWKWWKISQAKRHEEPKFFICKFSQGNSESDTLSNKRDDQLILNAVSYFQPSFQLGWFTRNP